MSMINGWDVVETSTEAAEHTPGPWVVLERYTDRNAIPIGYEVGNGATSIFAEVHGGGGVRGLSEGDANARLISAAPDLLSALDALLMEVDRGEIDEDTKPLVEAAERAIAKARGL